MTITDTTEAAAPWGKAAVITWDAYLNRVSVPDARSRVIALAAKRNALWQERQGVIEDIKWATVDLVESGEADLSQAARLAGVNEVYVERWIELSRLGLL